VLSRANNADCNKTEYWSSVDSRHDGACSMKSETCASTYPDSDRFYIEAEAKLQSLQRENATFDTRTTKPATGEVEGPHIVVTPEQQHKEYFVKDTNKESIQENKNQDPQLYANDHNNIDTDHFHQHQQIYVNDVHTMSADHFHQQQQSHGDMLYTPENQPQLYVHPVAQDIPYHHETLDCQSSQVLEENVHYPVLNEQPNDHEWPQDAIRTRGIAMGPLNPIDERDTSTPVTPKPQELELPKALLEQIERLKRENDELRTLHSNRGSEWQDGVLTGFSPGVGLGAIIGAAAMLLL